MDTRAAQRARWRAAIAKDEERDALIEDLMAVAQGEAARDRKANLDAAERWRFRDLVEDALDQLRSVPLSRPLPPKAWRLAARPEEHRKALAALARRVEQMVPWNLAAARAVESEPAVLALWLSRPAQFGPSRVEMAKHPRARGVWMAVGGLEMPLIVQAGKFPTRFATARRLSNWERRIPSRGGAGHDLGDGFDAGMMLLATAYAAVSGRVGEDVLAVSLSNGAADRQTDTGPVARFIHRVICRAGLHMPMSIGSQAINGALRRCRASLAENTLEGNVARRSRPTI